MGTKRAWKGKYFFLYLAYFAIAGLGIFGCSSLSKNNHYIAKKPLGEKRLVKAKVMLANGNYDGSFKEAREILNRYPVTYGSQALFLMGLIYAHTDNPEFSYRKSKDFFQKLIERHDFNKSNLKGEVEILTFLIQKMIDKENKSAKISKLQNHVNKLQKQVNEMQKQTDNQKTTQDEISKLQNQTSELQSQIMMLKDQIKRLKEIDLGIEEKKREILPQ